jgi:WD40 repeat protein
MAGVRRGQGSAIARVLVLLPALLFAGFANSAAMAQLYEQPVLVIDPGMHTAPIKALAVDSAGRLGVTGSLDKTVRVWQLADGKLVQTIRVPAGPNAFGQIFATVISPDGTLVAAAGYTEDIPGRQVIYLFDINTGKMTAHIGGLPNSISTLAFSPDGRYLAAGPNGQNGPRVYDRDQQWAEVFRAEGYGGDHIWGITFAADGRLAVSSYDGYVRLYDRDFKLAVPPRKATGGDRPAGISFSPDGKVLAVGYDDVPVVDLFDGHTLAPLQGPDVAGLNGALWQVTWSRDGKTLYAGGNYQRGKGSPVLGWADRGHGARQTYETGGNSVSGLAALPNTALAVAMQDPAVAVLEPSGTPRWVHTSPVADFAGQYDKLSVSADGTIVDFGFERFGHSPLRFDLHSPKLSHEPSADNLTLRPIQTGLSVEGWLNGLSPTLDGKPIELLEHEVSRSLAIHPDGTRFVIGAWWSLRAIDAKSGQRIWLHTVPGEVWAVNISRDGRLVVAAYDDGTIRWHRMDDGRELLALFVLADKQNWVAWTPEGFYGATPGAFGVLQWQVNHGFDAAPDTVPVSEIPRLRRPDALALVLQELEIARALGIADLKAARRDVQIATGAKRAPGARLHVLAIGVSDYGDKAKDLRLKFADRDAQDLASALVNTQANGLYADVKPIFLHDATADKAEIFDAFATMERNMADNAGQDLAVVMFSGHGTMIDNQFYLVPYGADDSTPARLQASAIPATEFQGKIAKLAEHGRVLVLLDACRSAALIGTALPAADLLKSVLAASNVTVLTSSTADKLSREDDKWQHGAFTAVLLQALSGSAEDIDTDHNGVISMSELTAYIAKHLSQLTGGNQQLGLDQRFQGDIFVAGL